MARELARYKLDLVGAGGYVGQRGHSKSRGLIFSMEKKVGNRIFFTPKRALVNTVMNFRVPKMRGIS